MAARSAAWLTTTPGQRCGRPHVASWAETSTVLAADLLAGNDDPRPDAAELLRRARAGLPAGIERVRCRADAGYFAGDLARAARELGVEFAIGAKRITTMWRALSGLTDEDWADAIDMPQRRSPCPPTGPPAGPQAPDC